MYKSQMVPTKTKPHASVANGRRKNNNRVEEVQIKSTQPVDHWAFLDEIEAPMWVDLTLEVKSTYEVKDDEWFHTTHPFHQCASRQLISAFSHSVDGCTNFDFGMQGPSSPKLPSSVSRSRGNHYKSRGWEKTTLGVTLSNRQLVKNLSSKSSLLSPGSGKKKESKARLGNAEEWGGLEPASVCESAVTEHVGPDCSIPLSNSVGFKPHSCSTAMKEGKSNSSSTITSESSVQQLQKPLEVPSQIFSGKSVLLSTLRLTLRKSCVTRQASRVERNGGRRSESCKSSSSRSSVGSSSVIVHDANKQSLIAKENKERTPDSRNVMTVSQATKNKVQFPYVSKAAFKDSNMTSNCSHGGETISSKYTHQETAKPRVQNRNLGANVSVPYRETCCNYKSTHVGKENAIGRPSTSQKSSTRERPAGGIIRRRSALQKGDRTKLVGSRRKISGQSEGKKPANVIQKVYLR